MNGALTYWIWAVEKGTLYIGTNKDGDKVQIATKTEKHVPIYNLTVTTYAKGSEKGKIVNLKKPFTGWFDKAGNFIPEPFQQMLASNVPLIGKADPKSVVDTKKNVARVEDEGKSMEDKWASLLAESSGVSLDDLSGATPSKPGKKRSKKG